MGSADSQSRSGSNIPAWWAATGIFGLSLLFFGSFFDYGLAVFDEGVLMQGIQLAIDGRMDFAKFCHYSSQYRWFALLFPDGRPDLEVVRAVWVVIRAATAGLIFLISARIVPKRWAWVPVALFLALPGPWHKAWVGFSLCLCLYAMVRVLERRTARAYFSVALAIAFAYAVHPYTAVPTLVAWCGVVVFTPAMRQGPLAGGPSLRRFVIWHGGFVLSLGAGTFLLADSIREVNPFALGAHNAGLIVSIASGSRFFAAQLMRGVSDPGIALVLSMYLVIAPVFMVSLWYAMRDWEGRGQGVPRSVVLCLVIVGILNLSKWAVRVDLAHFLQNAAPVWILLVFVVRQLVRGEGTGKRGGRVVGGLTCVWIVGVLIFGVTSSDTFIGGIGTRLFTKNVELVHPHGILHVKPEVRDSLVSLERAIREHSRVGDSVLVFAFPKILNYLAERRSPLIVPAIAFPSSLFASPVAEIVSEIRNRNTSVILFSDSPIIPKESFRLVNLAPEVYELITKEYRLVDTIGGRSGSDGQHRRHFR